MSDHAPSILLVDDDQVLRSQLVRAFERRGYDVRIAANFDEAIASAREDTPEFAVLDQRMPGKSGLELLRALKELDETTAIVVLTGYGNISSAVDATRLGAAWYLPKPADVDDILEAFERGQKPPLTETEATHTVPSLARAEWEHINRVLMDCAGNVSKAARRLGLHRRTLQRKLQKYPPNQ